MASGIVTLCVLTASVSAVTRNVPSEYPRIQAAIQAAEDGDVVLVAPGIYYETINFGGKDIVVTSTDPNDPKIVGYTIINAEEDGSVVTFENGETNDAVLTGFTITGGFGTLNNSIEGGGNIFWGGGIYCINATPTITKNVITGNRGPLMLGNAAQDTQICYGAGIASIFCNPIITNNIIRNNLSFVAGGLIAYGGQATVSNNVVYDNSAYLGGGVIMIGGSLLNNTIVANDCDQGPGAGLGGNVYIIFEPSLGYGQMINNIICNAPSGGGVLIAGDWRGGLVAFNDVWDNAPGNYALPDEQIPDLVHYDGEYDQTGKMGNISADPLFLDPFSRNFHLTLESPCVNAGDPALFVPPGQTDMDGENRIYAARIDIGADEYVGYAKPVASAGFDRHVLEPFQAVTLDGSQSFFYDPCGLTTYQWTQVSGPEVGLDDPAAAQPTFTPPAMGEYVFQLVVGDDRYNSEPDEVLVLVAENQAPVADAGPETAWQAPGRVTLDGTSSYDPDKVDRLTYQWTQKGGPAVDLEDADSGRPSFAVEAVGQYLFELVVSDGFTQSLPSSVQCVTVNVTSSVKVLNASAGQGAGPYHPDVSGTRVVYAVGMNPSNAYDWRIAWKDLMAGDVKVLEMGGMNAQPKIDGDLIVWSGGYSYTGNFGPDYAGVFVHDIATGASQALRSRTEGSSYGHPAVSGNKVVWVRHLGLDKAAQEKWYNMPYDICGVDLSRPGKPVYFTVATNVGRRDPFPFRDPFSDFDDVVDICGDIVVWEGDGNIYAADLSDLSQIKVFTVCDHPARQYDPAVSGRIVVWTDERNDYGDIYGADLSDPENIRPFPVVRAPGIQVQPAIDGPLVGYLDGSARGGLAKFACMTEKHGVLRADLADVPYAVTLALDGRTVVWLGSAYGAAQGALLEFGYSIFDGRVRNAQTGNLYDYIQHAINEAADGSEIVLPEGLYEEKIDFAGRQVTVRAANADDPAATVVCSGGNVVTFAGREGAESVLSGLTITGGNNGIYCFGATPTITQCVITGNRATGVRVTGQSDATLANCRITANGAAGIEMSGPSEGRVKYNEATIEHCLITANGGQGINGGKPRVINSTVVDNLRQGISGYAPTVLNSIIYFNGRDADGVQITSNRAVVTYSDIEGGWPGAGNIDADPQFATPGRWMVPAGSADGDAVWTPGDYHLKSRGWRWDAVAGVWTSDDVTSPCIDAGDPASELADEPLTAPADPGGPVINQRINMGLYGGTAEASLAPVAE